MHGYSVGSNFGPRSIRIGHQGVILVNEIDIFSVVVFFNLYNLIEINVKCWEKGCKKEEWKQLNFQIVSQLCDL